MLDKVSVVSFKFGFEDNLRQLTQDRIRNKYPQKKKKNHLCMVNKTYLRNVHNLADLLFVPRLVYFFRSGKIDYPIKAKGMLGMQ